MGVVCSVGVVMRGVAGEELELRVPTTLLLHVFRGILQLGREEAFAVGGSACRIVQGVFVELLDAELSSLHPSLRASPDARLLLTKRATRKSTTTRQRIRPLGHDPCDPDSRPRYISASLCELRWLR